MTSREFYRTLEYLNAEDVVASARFIAARVPAAFDGISKEGDSALSFLKKIRQIELRKNRRVTEPPGT